MFKIANKLIFIFSILIAAAVFYSGPVRADQPPTKVKVAIHDNFAPDMYLDSNGRPDGFAVKLLEKIAGELGWDLEFISRDAWSEIGQLVASGQADICPSMGVTARRKGRYDFTVPLGVHPISLIVRSGTGGITTLASLKGLKAAAVRLNISEVILARHPEIKAVVYDDFADALFALLAGEVEALVYPKFPALNRARKIGLGSRVKAVGSPLVEVKRAMGVVKGKKEILTVLNEKIESCRAEGAYQKLWLKYHNHDPLPFWDLPKALTLAGVTAALVLIIMGVWRYVTVNRLNRELIQHRDNLEIRVRERTAELEEALTNVRQLSGLLPICSNCKKIRDDGGYWHQVEEFVDAHSEASFTHSICPDCRAKLYPELADSDQGPAGSKTEPDD